MIESGFDIEWGRDLILFADEFEEGFPITQELTDYINKLRREPYFCLISGMPPLP